MSGAVDRAAPGVAGRLDPARPLEGRIALVTGGSRGIGAAIAARLAEAGARVAFTFQPGDPDEAGRLGVVAEVGRRSGAPGLAVPMEMRELGSIRAGIDAVVAELGGLDVLVNNAGTNVQQTALEVDEDTWDLIVETNLKGLFFCSQAAARAMIELGGSDAPWRSVVNVSSQMGLVGYYRRAAYCASKAAVVNLTRALAVEWAEHRIRVNAVAPTFVLTPLSAPMLADETFRADVVSRSPMGEIGTPDDVAEAVLFLASPSSRLVTGHTLAVEGGWTAW
jgi:NAD(P)-dependent dehydrogenase (short-subunit alcohol dehydrogenase family)